VATARARSQWRQLAVVAVVLCALTPAFNVLTGEASPRAALQGLVDAPLVTLLVGGYLMFVRDGRWRSWFRRLGFATDLALSSTIVLALFLVGRGAGQVATSLDPGRFSRSFTDAHLAYALPYFAVAGAPPGARQARGSRPGRVRRAAGAARVTARRHGHAVR
jgi:hypothetical protein